eukprot:TRINITY_DN911_c1_g1_i6.p1 TRINITY_DN911_c1_g1~~TRINITY_DN911_c1_g1_i6.p1  ORF type:complete len:176 (+),score=7.71 TRINITY_DN911_c1_g1_i6:105-632(+)
MKACTAPTSFIRGTFNSDNMTPFCSYLQRRLITNKDAAGSIRVIKNRLLSSSEKWFKYRLLSGTLEVRSKFFNDQRSICIFCKKEKETTDHIFWGCSELRETYSSIRSILMNSFGAVTDKEDFLAYFAGKEELKVNATIAKTQQVIYAKRSANDTKLRGIISIIKMYIKEINEID